MVHLRYVRVVFALFAFVRVIRVFRGRAQKTRRGAHANAIIAFFVKKLRLQRRGQGIAGATEGVFEVSGSLARPGPRPGGA